MYKIAVVAGDGTGPEVVAQGLKALDAVADTFSLSYTHLDLTGERYLRTGQLLETEDIETLKKYY